MWLIFFIYILISAFIYLYIITFKIEGLIVNFFFINILTSRIYSYQRQVINNAFAWCRLSTHYSQSMQQWNIVFNCYKYKRNSSNNGILFSTIVINRVACRSYIKHSCGSTCIKPAGVSCAIISSAYHKRRVSRIVFSTCARRPGINVW